MKYMVLQIKKMLNLQTILYSICFAVLVGYWSDRSNGLIVGVLGGIPDNGSRTLELLHLGKWLFLYAFFFFIICRELIANEKISFFVIYRFKDFKTWWRMHFCSVLITNAMVYTVVFFMWWTVDRINRQSNNMALVIYIIFLLHLSCMVSIIVFFDYFTVNKLAPSILIIVEGIAYVLSVNYNIPWLVCGMFNRSKFNLENGFHIVTYVMEMLVIFLCYIIVPLLIKGNILERKRR